MKSLFVAIAAATLAATISAEAGQRARVDGAAPAAIAPSTTFPALRTIYVAAGVNDSGDAANVGTATSVLCSNLSGQTAQIRWHFFNELGAVAGTFALNLNNLRTWTVSTHATFFGEQALGTGSIYQGMVIVQSNQSAFDCTAMIVDAAGPVANGVQLHMVRYNPHPGTVE